MKSTDEDWYAPYRLLFAAYGPQHWWPGETAFEVMVGAILTQNTAWANVERAIANLKAAERLTCEDILALPDDALAELIRPAGYFNVKARRLKALCAFLADQGVCATPQRLRDLSNLPELRRRLLSVHGVGEETADSILLYALELPIFVVDAYTRRIFSRLGLIPADASYGEIQQAFQRHLPADVALYNEYHALIVHLGKSVCRPKPRCEQCPLRERCPGG
ncbi:MAG: endonuclease III domain-containing protein [Thiobacillaceae bacterium]